MIIDRSQLAHVVGGNDASFGRCGPGSRWSWLGDVYTPECATHDAQVRGSVEAGDHPVIAHVKALPSLPSAVGSYLRARISGT